MSCHVNLSVGRTPDTSGCDFGVRPQSHVPYFSHFTFLKGRGRRERDLAFQTFLILCVQCGFRSYKLCIGFLYYYPYRILKKLQHLSAQIRYPDPSPQVGDLRPVFRRGGHRQAAPAAFDAPVLATTRYLFVLHMRFPHMNKY